MNNLSWLLYLSGIAENIQMTLAVMGGFLFTGSTIYICEAQCSGLGEKETKARFKRTRKWFYLVPVLWLIAALVPNSTSIRLIAASEIGQTVVESSEGQEILNDVKTIIKQQIKGLKQ